MKKKEMIDILTTEYDRTFEQMDEINPDVMLNGVNTEDERLYYLYGYTTALRKVLEMLDSKFSETQRKKGLQRLVREIIRVRKLRKKHNEPM